MITDCLDYIDNFISTNFESFKNKFIVFCWSGGKDSTALLFLLSHVIKKKSLALNVVLVPFPNAVFDYKGLDETLQYWKNLGIEVMVLQHKYLDPNNVPYLKMCTECKKVRRLVLEQYFLDVADLKNTSIITGHNLWDLAAYLVEMMLSQLVNNPKNNMKTKEERYLEVMNKFLPCYHHSVGPTIIRPFITFSDFDIDSVIKTYDIPDPFPFISQPCPWLEQRKRMLHKYFKTMKLDFSSEKIMEFVRESFRFPTKEDFSKLPFLTYIL